MKQSTRRLRAIEKGARSILERVDPHEEHVRFAIYLWCGAKPADEDLDAAWRAAIERADLVCGMLNTIPGPTPDDRHYPGSRLDRLVSASLSPRQRAALDRLRPAAFWKRFEPLREAMLERVLARWDALAAKDPRLEGSVSGLEAAFASLEEKHGLTPLSPYEPLGGLAPPLPGPPAEPEPLRRPAGW